MLYFNLLTDLICIIFYLNYYESKLIISTPLTLACKQSTSITLFAFL
jgi:hypothetical protein